MTRPRLLVFSILLLSGLPGRDLRAQMRRFDVMISGGRIIDGTGNPWRLGDVGISGDSIVAVGRLGRATAARRIDATGKVVVPGFIDLHSHAGGPIYGPRGLRSPDPRRRAAPNLVAQGITTVVVNQDGRSVWPIAEQRRVLERLRFGPNAILMVGHGTVRREVMHGDFRRAATPDEVERMRQRVRQGMEEGAFGMSAGLEYVPGRWSTTAEVAALVAEIVPFGGVYISHERSEGADPMWYWPSQYDKRPPSLLDAVRETIEIGRQTGATVVASHIKAKGADYWGTAATVIRLINQARVEGIAVYADQYPYNTTGSDGNTVLIPSWVWRSSDGRVARQQDFARGLRDVLDDATKARALRRDIAHEIQRRGGASQVLVMDYVDSSYVGKSVGALASARHITPVALALALQLEGDHSRRGGARLRGFSLSEYDIEPYARQPWTATATDGWIALPEDGPTHPRVYGTYPRKIQHYALERGITSVEDAVRSASSLPAQILGLRDRGFIAEGFAADVVVLDLGTLEDKSTFFDPHQYPSGVDYVMVNGTFVVDRGEITWVLPGMVITPASAKERQQANTSGR
ncbi:MAG: amidohydrolase family protein [Gemmatimonadales bacterium]